MRRPSILPAILGLSLTACSTEAPERESARAQPRTGGEFALRSGEQVYREVCMACHATGVAGAPKFGDRASWGPLIEEGQAKVTAHGWVGMGDMPPRGGRPDLGLEAFARAVAWMARSGGAGWQDPDEDMLHAIREEERQRIAELAKRETADAD